MIVKKVNIDELVQVLLDMRKNTEFIDMQITEGNVLKVKKHDVPPPPEDNRPLTDRDLNQLIA